MIAIIDYGLGNLGSIKNMLRKIGYDSIITKDKEEISNAEKLILPGVGAFDTGMQNLIDLELIDVINQKVKQNKTPILGICLGAQLMCNKSEEGKQHGLGWFDAEVVSFKSRFDEGKELPVPNMGWIDVKVQKQNKLIENLPDNPRFYFVHSYFILTQKKEDILLTSQYGINYTSALQRENLFAVQFHPEKSHKYGFQLLKNFAEIGL